MKSTSTKRALLIGSFIICVVGCVFLSLSRANTTGCTCNQLPLDSTTCSAHINQCPVCTFARLNVYCSDLAGHRDPLGAIIHNVNATGTQGSPYNSPVNCWEYWACKGSQYTNECVPIWACQGEPDRLCDDCAWGSKTILKQDSFHCTTCTEL